MWLCKEMTEEECSWKGHSLGKGFMVERGQKEGAAVLVHDWRLLLDKGQETMTLAVVSELCSLG
jgi:hypothetical protein